MNALLIKYDRCLWFIILPYFPMQSFYLPHTKCKILNLTNLYSEHYKILPKDKSLFGGQVGDDIFAKKPIKSAKTHFF